MTDPMVLCETGLSYQRDYIEAWIATYAYHPHKRVFMSQLETVLNLRLESLDMMITGSNGGKGGLTAVHPPKESAILVGRWV
jgi:hypothetical protein